MDLGEWRETSRRKALPLDASRVRSLVLPLETVYASALTPAIQKSRSPVRFPPCAGFDSLQIKRGTTSGTNATKRSSACSHAPSISLNILSEDLWYKKEIVRAAECAIVQSHESACYLKLRRHPQHKRLSPFLGVPRPGWPLVVLKCRSRFVNDPNFRPMANSAIEPSGAHAVKVARPTSLQDHPPVAFGATIPRLVRALLLGTMSHSPYSQVNCWLNNDCPLTNLGGRLDRQRRQDRCRRFLQRSRPPIHFCWVAVMIRNMWFGW